MWHVLDTGLYYVMNAILMVLAFADKLLDFSDRAVQNYELAKKVFTPLLQDPPYSFLATPSVVVHVLHSLPSTYRKNIVRSTLASHLLLC